METTYCPFCMSETHGQDRCPRCGNAASAYVTLTHHLAPDTLLHGRYLMGGVLGEGGSGITYIARDGASGDRVAIKEYFPKDTAARIAATSIEVVPCAGISRESFARRRARFLHQAHQIASVKDDGVIVELIDAFEDNGTAYAVMEYVEGSTLLELAQTSDGRIPLARLLEVTEPVFGALGALHAAGLIHRDVSPDNIMLADDGVRLIDFGSARESIRGTRNLTVMLKDGYAPIEQYSHRGQGPWTDVYGLSATLYRCLTGTLPPSALDRQIRDELVRPRSLGVQMSRSQEAALMRGLSVRPTRRFRSVAAFHDALFCTDRLTALMRRALT